MQKTIKKFFIKTFGCVQNVADSERIKAYYWNKGFEEVNSWKDADEVVINTCVVRESAENRIYGLVNEINKYVNKTKKLIDITLTGCLVGLKKTKRIKGVTRILPNHHISLDIGPLRNVNKAALIPISTGCNNYCSYCIVPYARGKEVSRSFIDIENEANEASKKGFQEVILIGQNVNSYGTDFVRDKMTISMGKKRYISLFPNLLKAVSKIGFRKVSFVSSNPWDFSDELIEVIAKNQNIDRLIHLPVQSGDDEILKKMNRGYTSLGYLNLVKFIKQKVPQVRFSTDIIVGFPGEDERAFQNTINLCKLVGFEIAYINKYSPREGTLSAKLYKNDVLQAEKKKRWMILNEIINVKS